MLSTQYRLKVEGICEKIVKGESVELSEMIWIEKLAKVNRTAGTMLRQARRRAANPDMPKDGLDEFLNTLDLGNPDPRRHITRFESVDDIVDFFHNDDEMRPD